MFITSATLDFGDQTPALQTIHQNVERYGKISVAVAFGRNDAIRALAASDIAATIGNCWIAASSCRRAASDLGVTHDMGLQVALLCIHDEQGQYATASSSLNGVARDIASRLVITAMEKANKPGQVPGQHGADPGRAEGAVPVRQTVGCCVVCCWGPACKQGQCVQVLGADPALLRWVEIE